MTVAARADTGGTRSGGGLWVLALLATIVAGVLASVALFSWLSRPAADIVGLATFGRSLAPGWGAADAGGDFVLSGTKSDYSVAGGVGNVVVNGPGLSRRAVLPAIAVRDAELTFRVAVETGLTGGGAFVYALMRNVEGSGEYRAKVRFASTGSVYVGLTAVRGETERALGPEERIPDLAYSRGANINVRARVEGDRPARISLKVWPSEAREPPGWNVRAMGDVPGLDVAGTAGVHVYAASDATALPIEFRFDDIQIRTLPAPEASAAP